MPNKKSVRRGSASKATKATHHRSYYYFFLLLNAIIWGAAFVIIKPAYEYTTPFRFLFYRFLIAGLIGSPLFLYYLHKTKDVWKQIKTVSLIEVLGIPLALGFLYTGLERTTTIEAGFLTTTVPIFVVLFGVWFLHEREEKTEAEGLGIAFLGALLLTFTPLLFGEARVEGVSLTGNVYILAHNIIIASYYVLAKKYYQTMNKFFVASISFFVGIFSFFLLSLSELSFSVSAFWQVVQTDLVQPSVQLASLYMGILGSVVAFTAYIIGQDGVEASEATLFSYLQPLVYVPLGIFLLGESIHWQQAIALVLIAIGVALGEWRRKKKA